MKDNLLSRYFPAAASPSSSGRPAAAQSAPQPSLLARARDFASHAIRGFPLHPESVAQLPELTSQHALLAAKVDARNQTIAIQAAEIGKLRAECATLEERKQRLLAARGDVQGTVASLGFPTPLPAEPSPSAALAESFQRESDPERRSAIFAAWQAARDSNA